MEDSCSVGEFYKIKDIDELTRQIIDLHFDPKSGSSFWLKQVENPNSKLDFNPRDEIETYDDLKEHFPIYTQNDFRGVPTHEFVPKSILKRYKKYVPFRTGGTTGDPIRVPYLEETIGTINEYWKKFLDLHNFPTEEKVLYIGPSDAQAIGYFAVNGLSKILNSPVFPVHVDASWIKEKLKEGNMNEFQEYMKYIMKNALNVFEREKPSILFSTAKIIEMLPQYIQIETLSEQINGVIHGGIEMSEDVYRLFKEELFNEKPILGCYGNTLFGAAFQAPPTNKNDFSMDYYPTYPLVSFEVIDPQTGEFVEDGERGQVVFTRMTPECFIPKKIERDIATKVSARHHEDLQNIYSGVRLAKVVGVRNVENLKESSSDGKPTLGVY